MNFKKGRIKTIDNAEKYVKGGKLREAIKEYQKLLKRDPQDINIINIIGDLYVRLKENDKAQEEFRKIATYYEEKGLYPQAIAIYKKIIKLNPEDSELAVKLADLYGNYGFITEAKKEYLRVAEKLRKSHKITEVIPLYEKLIKLDKEDFESRLTLAELYEKEGLVDEAVEELNTVAEVKLQNEKLKEARDLLLRANNIKENNVRTVTNLYDLFKREDKKKEAFALLTSALKKDKENLKFLQLLGTLYFEDQNFSKAKEIFSQIQSMEALDVETRVKLGRIYIQEGNLNEAFDLYEPLIDALIARQKVEKAIGLLGLILTSKEAHLPSLEKLATIYELNNQRDKLETVFRVILEEYREDNLKEKSFSILEKLVKLCPEDVELVTEYRHLQEELGYTEIEEKRVEPSELSDKDREIIKMKLAKVDSYLEQGAIQDARKILEGLKSRYSDESRIDQKIAILDEIRAKVEAEDVMEKVEEVEKREPEVEKEEVEGEKEDTEKITAADIFAETDILPEISPEVERKQYYDLTGVIEGELEIIRTIIQHQLKGDTETFEHDLSDIVTKFKQEMDEKLDKEDSEIHYNLGVAFLEQGLVEEAIEEFKLASQDKERVLECYSVISYCCKQKKDYEEGVRWIEKGLEITEKGSTQYLALKYDLASLYEEMKEREKALKLYNEIQEFSTEYRAVGERIKSLKRRSSKS